MPKKTKEALERARIIEAKTAKICSYSTIRIYIHQAIEELMVKMSALERLLLPAVPIPDGPSNIEDIMAFDKALTLEIAKAIIRGGVAHRREMKHRYDQFVSGHPAGETVAEPDFNDTLISPPTIDELIESMEKEEDKDDDDEGSIN